jgi:hypothetical protein
LVTTPVPTGLPGGQIEYALMFPSAAATNAFWAPPAGPPQANTS